MEIGGVVKTGEGENHEGVWPSFLASCGIGPISLGLPTVVKGG